MNQLFGLQHRRSEKLSRDCEKVQINKQKTKEKFVFLWFFTQFALSLQAVKKHITKK